MMLAFLKSFKKLGVKNIYMVGKDDFVILRLLYMTFNGNLYFI